MNSENKVMLEFTEKELMDISNTLSDILCWISGFKAAQPDLYIPFEISEIRELNIKVKNNIKREF